MMIMWYTVKPLTMIKGIYRELPASLGLYRDIQSNGLTGIGVRWTLLFVVVILSVVWGLISDRVSVTDVELAHLDQPCEPTVPIRFAGSGVTEDDAFSFFNNGFVGLKVCDERSVTLMTRGSVVAGVGAHLVIHNATDLLWEGLVVDDTMITLEVRPGWLTFAFLNDAASADEDRNLWIFDLSFGE